MKSISLLEFSFSVYRNVELPFVWALLEPVLYTRDDFAKQTQPIEIERIVSEASPFHVEPSRGTFSPLATVEFRLIFAPSLVIEYLFSPSLPSKIVCLSIVDRSFSYSLSSDRSKRARLSHTIAQC